MLSEKTSQILKKNGWTEDRQVPTTEWQRYLEKNGFKTFPGVLQFLSNFGGLDIEYPRNRAFGKTDTFNFDPIKAANFTFPENVALYEKTLGAELSPIGQVYRGHMVLLMDPTGRVFAAFDDVFILKLGETVMDAVEALCSDRELERIPIE